MEKGLVIVYTGEGKGKTTAAFGLCVRALGWGKKVCVIQFMKSPDFVCGEKEFCKQNHIPLYTLGIGYSWKHSPEVQAANIKKAWEFTEEMIRYSDYDLVILDEINVVLSQQRKVCPPIVEEEMVIEALKQRPEKMDVVLTGRGAGEKLMAYADTVSEIKCVKHAYEQGIVAKKGIEY